MNGHRCNVLQAAFVVSFLVVAIGCAVGPTYHPPQAPDATRFPAEPLPDNTVATDTTGGQAQRFVARDIAATWWQVFENQELDALVKQALLDSPSLAQVSARLTQAREELDARQRAAKYPQVGVGGAVNVVGATTGGFASNELSQSLSSNLPLTLGLASVDVSYSLDLFGKKRYELESLAAAADYQRFQLEGSRLMLAGNIVTTAIEEASIREQLQRTEAIAALQSRQVEIVERLETVGGVARLEVIAQQGELARTRAVLPALRQRLAQTRHRLAVYLGQAPSAVKLPSFYLKDLHLPTELPLSLPSELARQRPDILAAEALMRAASARVGVAEANRYPQITLSGTGGAVAVSSLISGAGFALLGASVAQPLFRRGQLEAETRAAVAAFDQAQATYREVVLTSLQNVADVLVALDGDARTLQARKEIADRAREAYDITLGRYQSGGVSLRALLDAERQHLSAALDEVSAIASRYSNSAALFQALGGGWWTALPPEN